MSFEDKIREWVVTDNRIRHGTNELKIMRLERVDLADGIIDYVASHNMTNQTVQISDGIIKFQNTKITSPLTFKFIRKCLNDCISSEEQVNRLISYIKEKRVIRYTPEVKRIYKSV